MGDAGVGWTGCGVMVLLFRWRALGGNGWRWAAGWLRIYVCKSLLFIFIGNASRYAALAFGFAQLF